MVATIGTTSTTAIDPLPAIGEICREYGVWLHVDAAYAGAAAVCPELRWSHAGLEYADSYCFDPHKWLLTGFDCDAFWVADRAELIEALTVLPEYLRNAATESGAVIDYRDWQVPLGRRFRALKLWFVLRWYGAEGLRAHIRSGDRPGRSGSPSGSAPTTGSRWSRRTRSRWSASAAAGRPSGGRRGERRTARPGQRDRSGLPDPHPGRRPATRCGSRSARRRPPTGR